MKKICICTTVSVTMKSFVVPTVEYLHNTCGYDITLICNDDNAFRESLPEYIHFIPVHMARGVDIKGFKSVLSLIKVFKREHFDMVQYSTPNASCYASIAAKHCHVPIRLYCQWGIRYVGLSGLKRKIFKAIEKVACRNSTIIRAVSPLNKQFAVNEGLYREEKASIVGNGGTIGVDSSVYSIAEKAVWKKEIREKYNLADDDFVLGFSGRISIDKGCRELLTAFRSLSQNYPKSKLFVVGPFEEHCGIDPELLRWARESKQVVFTGLISGKDMCKYYSAMDVLVHPTYREGFGMVIQEAGALAVPTITTKIPGASEVMVDGISSIHIEAKNSESLFKAMEKLLNDPELTEKLGEEAYRRTMELYERQIMLENQRKDYINILGE